MAPSRRLRSAIGQRRAERKEPVERSDLQGRRDAQQRSETTDPTLAAVALGGLSMNKHRTALILFAVHPHIYLKMGDASEIVCPYCSTLFRFDPSLGGATLGQTYTQLHCARFRSARDRTCRAYREDRSTLPIENQSFVSSGDGVFIPAFSFPGFDSIPGVILAKHRPKFPTALRGLLAKPLLKQDR